MFLHLHFKQVILPALKYLRGDTFSDKHWTELLIILEIPNKKLEVLTFGDFLSVKENILLRFQEIQVIDYLLTF